MTATIFALSLAALAGCDDAGYQELDNGLFISEAAPSNQFNQQVVNLTVKGNMSTSIHLRLAQVLDKETHAVLELAPDLVKTFNSRNGTSYMMLPEEYVSFEKNVTIPAGTISSDAVEISIKEFPTDNGEAYCIPLRIASSDAPVDIMEASGKIIYLLTKPLIQVVPVMDSSVKPTGSGDWNVATSEWTIEGWVYMDFLNINNQAIFNASVPSDHGTEIYIRFGDAGIPYNQLQIKTGGSQFESSTLFEINKWYHIAYTYANGKCILYVNGVEDASKEFSPTDYIINNLSLCSSGGYWRANGRMAQVRFWKKALSAEVIKDAMGREVPDNSDGLVAYWKLNEGKGDVFHDATSNGFDLKCSVAPKWTDEEVDFTEPNKE